MTPKQRKYNGYSRLCTVHEDIAVGGKPGLDSFGNFPKNMLSEPLLTSEKIIFRPSTVNERMAN